MLVAVLHAAVTVTRGRLNYVTVGVTLLKASSWSRFQIPSETP